MKSIVSLANIIFIKFLMNLNIDFLKIIRIRKMSKKMSDWTFDQQYLLGKTKFIITDLKSRKKPIARRLKFEKKTLFQFYTMLLINMSNIVLLKMYHWLIVSF